MIPRRVLVTGINGFVGPWLARHILAQDPSVDLFGMAWGDQGREALCELEGRVTVLDGDLASQASLKEVVEASRPDLVIHLAGASSVVASWTRPTAAFEINTLGQLRLFEALLTAQLSPLVVVASSAEVYGSPSLQHQQDQAITEERPVAPISPYGVSKASQELVTSMYSASRELPSIRLRLFNLIGPGQGSCFAASSFARQIAEIEAGRQAPVVRVGDLEVARDLTDVRDAVRAFWLAGCHGEPGATYNLCSGTAVRLRNVVETLLGLASRPIETVVDPSLLRPVDIRVLKGSSRRLRQATGWRPELPLDQTLSDLLDWWRDRRS